MKCTRVFRRVTSGAFKYNLANSRARGSALPFGTTSAITPPFVRGLRRERLWVEEERLRPSRSSAITPHGKDSVARHNASREVRDIVEGRTLAGDDHVGQQRIL